MELLDLKYFCVAAELEHITRAADILGVSQPFLSKVIRRLEEELGTELFDHVGRAVVLNDYGRIVYTRAKQLVMGIDNIKLEIAEKRDIKEKTISLVTNAVIYVPRLLNAFYAENQDYTVFISSMHQQNIKKKLAFNEVDFALCSPPLSEDIDTGLKTEYVFSESTQLVLPPAHPLRLKQLISIKDLHGERMIISPEGFGMRNRLDKIFERHGVKPEFVIETGEVADIIQFVRQGICASMSARTSCSGLRVSV